MEGLIDKGFKRVQIGMCSCGTKTNNLWYDEETEYYFLSCSKECAIKLATCLRELKKQHPYIGELKPWPTKTV